MYISRLHIVLLISKIQHITDMVYKISICNIVSYLLFTPDLLIIEFMPK